MLLPLGFWASCGWLALLFAPACTFFFAGVEQIGLDLENPMECAPPPTAAPPPAPPRCRASCARARPRRRPCSRSVLPLDVFSDRIKYDVAEIAVHATRARELVNSYSALGRDGGGGPEARQEGQLAAGGVGRAAP